ncbi:MAG: GTP cyclohydrolase I FolE [Actinobacteria bacterium]|nr:GTP cyclohydrolase I FolE [Actinomycetota bacterium]
MVPPPSPPPARRTSPLTSTLARVEPKGFDRERIERGVRLILEGIGEDPDRPGIAETPRRVAEMYAEVFAGIGHDPAEVVTVIRGADHDEMIMVRDIPLTSLCEHHLVPFSGRAHVAYIPNRDGRITGLSKVARLVDLLSKRPQVQERLTTEIAETLDRVLEPRGVFVVIEAEHLCMTMRGVKKPGSTTVTSAVRGRFRSDARTRAEAMSLLRRNGA